jgi:hypothetical protein
VKVRGFKRRKGQELEMKGVRVKKEGFMVKGG